ncbi:hypothetical protein LSH36_518g02002 [Paralvinella palmiformis]|uniref:Serine palmitoyltransferase small subunit B n=1 Tax=Paralvinella palmiformis TaxID=53620 RepID=A0AAD9J8B1_9ANNE|nr:hypothetical protein LSH36_518g02002 [Paralvinella palmiformis]
MGYNPMRVVYDYFMWLYFQYSVSLCLPLLEPWEIKMLNTILVALFATTVYTTYSFLPPHLAMWTRVLTSPHDG